MLPLPDTYQAPLSSTSGSANVGLIFDRGANHWDEAFAAKAPPATAFLKEVQPSSRRPAAGPLLKDLLARRKRLLTQLGGREVNVSTVWRLVSGFGMSHVLQNGFVWDRNLGVPYLPGSTVKGLIRAWAEQWNSEQWEQSPQVRALFGDTEELGAGTIIFHDAFPTRVPALELDVMAVHAGSYYRDSEKYPPVDNEAPNLVTFLTVPPGTPFSFGLSPRPGVQSPDLDMAEVLCRAALKTLGIGSKTAVGYGRLE